MPYITREDGEHFVIPSYRDTLVVKQKSVLKKEIINFSKNYGEFITLQEKGANQYEVAFSPDTGYLLGESIWHYFKRPIDLIYCEAIPNTTEVLLVIVKTGSVYLDGRFPAESIAEELIIFLTQQNSFEIYVYGDVPLSKMPETGKFNFEEVSVKSFNVLDQPVFPSLPLYKIYQLQLVDTVLKAHGIGVYPIKPLLAIAVGLFVLYLAYSYISSHKEVIQIAPPPRAPVNPYADYNKTLNTPSPDDEINQFLQHYQLLFTVSGWQPTIITYTNGSMKIAMKSNGGSVEDLFNWARINNKQVNIEKTGFFLTDTFQLQNRPVPNEIYAIKDVIAIFVDRLASVYPGNHLDIGDFAKKETFTEVFINVKIDNASPLILSLIAEQLKGLPITLQNMNLTVNNGNLAGTIILLAVGS